MKTVKTLYLFIGVVLLLFTSCIDRNMPATYNYQFSIVDSVGNNIVGDSIFVKKYNIDSLKYYSSDGIILRDNFRYSFQNYFGYIFYNYIYLNQTDEFIIKYNSIITECDTIKIIYGKHNVNVYRNNELILNKEDISQTTEVLFKIIK